MSNATISSKNETHQSTVFVCVHVKHHSSTPVQPDLSPLFVTVNEIGWRWGYLMVLKVSDALKSTSLNIMMSVVNMELCWITDSNNIFRL